MAISSDERGTCCGLVRTRANSRCRGTEQRSTVVRRAGEPFLANLDQISVEDLCEAAEKAHILEDEKSGADFAI